MYLENKCKIVNKYDKLIILIKEEIYNWKFYDIKITRYASKVEKSIIRKYKSIFTFWDFNEIVERGTADNIIDRFKYSFSEEVILNIIDILSNCFERYLEKKYPDILEKYPGNTYILINVFKEVQEKCLNNMSLNFKDIRGLKQYENVITLLSEYKLYNFEDLKKVSFKELYVILKSDESNIYKLKNLLEWFVYLKKYRPPEYKKKAIPYLIFFILHIIVFIAGVIFIFLDLFKVYETDGGWWLCIVSVLFGLPWYDNYKQMLENGRIMGTSWGSLQ